MIKDNTLFYRFPKSHLWYGAIMRFLNKRKIPYVIVDDFICFDLVLASDDYVDFKRLLNKANRI